MKRTVQMAKGNVTKITPGVKLPPPLGGCVHRKNGEPKRAMAKRSRAPAMGNLGLMAAIAGPLRAAMLNIMAYARQQTEANEKRKEELRKRGPQ